VGNKREVEDHTKSTIYHQFLIDEQNKWQT